MGDSDERNSNAIDASVGGLVWIRRRNGSWWPGRIMDLDEVPEGSLISPKAGTPIKLLGRDDASVDWYNLEKSKRVKAFRCGEYNDCIEKAKAAVVNNGKKAVKYARREDAILHALEIERTQLGKDPTRFVSSKDNLNTAEAIDSDETISERESNSVPELLQSALSFEDSDHLNGSKMDIGQERRRRTPNDSEDDGTEGIKRMRGLKDIGKGVSSKRKRKQESGLLEQSTHGIVPESELEPACSLPNGSNIAANKDCPQSLKRKRSRVSKGNESSKRKSKCRALTKVLESTAMVSVPVNGFSESKIPEMESNESKSLSAVINNNSDSTGVSCENAVSLTASEIVCEASLNKGKDNEISSLSVSAENSSDRLLDVQLVRQHNHSAGRQSGQGTLAEAVGADESGCITSSAAHIDTDTEKSASKWQSKGKRKSRQISRRQDPRNHVETSEPSTFLPWGPMSARRANPRFALGSRFMMQDSAESSSSLFTVKIEVQAIHGPRNVPLVSLMSRLNGKAIVGHPIVVEVLEDGVCDRMVASTTQIASNVSTFESSNKSAQTGIPKARKPTRRNKQKSHLSTRKTSKSKKSASISKKTKRLSSLTSLKSKTPALEKLKEPVVACIPLKLAFSRINEAVNGSARQNRSLPSTLAANA